MYILINIITCLLLYSDYCINNFQANVFFLILKKCHYDFDFQWLIQINYITGNETILLFCYDDDNNKCKIFSEIMNKSDNKKIL